MSWPKDIVVCLECGQATDHPVFFSRPCDGDEPHGPTQTISVVPTSEVGGLVEIGEFVAEEYGQLIGLVRDLLRDAARIYEPGFEDPPHIAAARDLTEHEGARKDLETALTNYRALRGGEKDG